MQLSQTQTDFREGMSRLGAAVNLVTTDGTAGRYGIVASAVCSVTDTPPTLLVCINRESHAHDLLVENGVLAVNVLTAQQQELCGPFTRHVEGVDRFDHGHWACGQSGAPLLEQANVSFDCRIEERLEQGSHSVMFCRVVNVHLAEQPGHGLVYFGRRFHSLAGLGQA